MTFVAVALMLAGSVLGLLAAVGLLRFPDLYTRLHSAAKAGPLGAGLILLGVAFTSTDFGVEVRCLLGLAFLILVSPISAHLLARAALRSDASSANIASIKTVHDSR